MICKLFGFFVLIQLISFINCESNCSREEFVKADETFVTLTVFGDPKAEFPTDDAGFKRQCIRFNNEQQYMKQFAKKCLSAFSKQTSGLLFRGVKMELKKYCSQENRARFSKANKCGAAALKESRGCLKQFVKEMEKISNVDQENQLSYVCCSTYNIQDCLRRVMTPKAACSAEAVDSFVNMVKGYTDETRQLICSGVDYGSPKCIDINKEFKKLPSRATGAKSPLLPFLDITNKF